MKTLYTILFSVFIAWYSGILFAAEHIAEPVSKSFFSGVAIGGRDSVAYHHQHKRDSHQSTKGNSDFTVEWKGATWRFFNELDSEAFRADPEKFAPAYNGFCANALSLGNGLVKTNGTHWQIYDNQLFLFYSRPGRQRWLDGNYRAYKVEADSAWKEILRSKNG